MKKFVLASTSPRRRELMKRLGVPFEVIAPSFEETPSGLPPEDECLHFAEQKARSIASKCPDALVLGADTLIECGGEVLGKPKDAEDAAAILKKLSGRTHRVLSAVFLLNTALGMGKGHVEIASVTFRILPDRMIRDYVASGEPMGKAGAYAVQGKARQLFIEKVEGEEEAVIGLPLRILREWLHSSSAQRA